MPVPISQYQSILVIKHGSRATLNEIVACDLVVYEGGRVLKDRYGTLRYLTPAEMEEVRRRVA